jgi:hypothetical protein
MESIGRVFACFRVDGVKSPWISHITGILKKFAKNKAKNADLWPWQ